MARDHKVLGKLIGIAAAVTGAAFVGLTIAAKKKKPDSVYENEPEQKNPLEGKKVVFVEDETEKENADGVKGHLEATGESEYHPGFYDRYVKRGLDIVLSFGGLVALSPIMGGIALAIKIEDPGPILFTQKRTGKNKQYFKLHKFRSMKMCTPHDVPTHMLENPDQYITKVGRFIRAHSLDELPQIWDIFIGNMSVIGPRPGLWNQDLLTAERDKYGANDVRPGLTGWAQINGRDELEIPEKAKLDGEYCKNISFAMDAKVFLGSLHVFGKDDSVVEGGTGKLKEERVERSYTEGRSTEELIGHIGFGETVEVDAAAHKKVLVTAEHSYIGNAFAGYAGRHYGPNFDIDFISTRDETWKSKDFSSYDVVYHVAGLAHADVGNVSEETKNNYYRVNTDLTVALAKKARAEGVKEFIFMSSMIVYGDSAPYGKTKVVDEHTVPTAANFYGDSKLQADVAVRSLATDTFKVIVLRPPMIYGRGSKGNYPLLAKLAKKLPVFPCVDNQRSMLHIDNLCEFLCQLMLVKAIRENAVVLVPQNAEWTNTSEMVKEIAEVSGKKIYEMKIMAPAVAVGSKVPGKIGGLVNKAFGSSCYAHEISIYPGMNYQTVTLHDSIEKTEGGEETEEADHTRTGKPKALMLASVASMIDQFNMGNIQLLLDMGYDVDVACNCKSGNTVSEARIESMIERLSEKGVDVIHVPIPRKITNVRGIAESYKQVKQLCDLKYYDLLHCHSPIGSVIARLAAVDARKHGTKVIYTAHGFHFYKGAPKKNWLVYYPVEKACAALTDVLITINKEDYEFAKGHLPAKHIEYIPGVGIDVKSFHLEGFDANAKKQELGLRPKDIMVLSVGELNQNKNHETVIRAIAQMNNPCIHYFIAGKGEKADTLEKTARELDVNLHLLGYRTDVVELLNAADVFVHPSFREGLSVALMEAMAAGVPCVVSRIRGNVDLIQEGKNGYLCNPAKVEDFQDGITSALIMEQGILNIKDKNDDILEEYDIKQIRLTMSKIYS